MDSEQRSEYARKQETTNIRIARAYNLDIVGSAMCYVFSEPTDASILKDASEATTAVLYRRTQSVERTVRPVYVSNCLCRTGAELALVEEDSESGIETVRLSGHLLSCLSPIPSYTSCPLLMTAFFGRNFGLFLYLGPDRYHRYFKAMTGTYREEQLMDMAVELLDVLGNHEMTLSPP